MLPLKKDIRLVRSLHQKKFRNLNALFIAEGLKIVEEALHSEFKLHSLYSSDDAFCAAHPQCIKVNSKEMEQISALSSASSHLVVLHQWMERAPDPHGKIVLVLDGIADPGNMGTILRTAEWFGIQDVFCTPQCVELYNPKCVQSTMGSIFRMRLHIHDAKELGPQLKQNGYFIVGAEMQGTDLYDYAFSAKTAIVIGSESHGISSEMKKILDASVTIPGAGKAESLNAAIAASILMSESFRRSR